MNGAARCGVAHCGARLEEQHDRALGRVTFACPWCARRRAGVCRHCPRPVYGARGRAIYCADCKAAATRRAWRKSQSLHRDERNQRARQKSKLRTPEQRARRAAQKRAWLAARPDRKRAYTRAYLLGPSRAHYLEYQRDYNAKRAERKRQQMRERYYRDHPVRPDPHCAGCAERIPWSPKPKGRGGRPPKWCDACRPYSYRKAA